MSNIHTSEQKPITLIVERLLIRDKQVNAAYRVVRVDRYTSHTWLCRIDDDSWPEPVHTALLHAELNSPDGRYEIEFNDPWWDHSSPVYSTEEEEKNKGNEEEEKPAKDIHHDRRFDQLAPLLSPENQYLLLVKNRRKELIQRRVKELEDTELKCTRQTLTTLIKLFWKRGMNFAALRPSYENCGAKGQPRANLGKKVGPKRTISPGVGINSTPDVKKLLRIGADFYLSKSRPTLIEAYDYIIALYFSRVVTDHTGNAIRIIVEPDAKPTVRQLQYYIQTNYPRQYRRRRRYGDKNWELNERELLGTVDRDVQGPGDRFHVDATIADVYLVSQYDRRRIVGRPVIYFIVDVFSRLITGVYVGFEGPSWIGAMMALVNMVTPKVEYCREYGVEISEAEWPSHYAPRTILADKGELMSVKLGSNITKNLRIQIENAASGRPDMKSIVEPRFGIVPRKWKQFTPGYVEKDFDERGSRDYRLDAAATLPEFTAMVIRAVIEHNFTPISNKSIHAEMVTDGLTSAPIDLWNWGIANRSGSLKVLTVEEVALNVMPTGKAKVTAHGIEFLDEYYTCAAAIQWDWFATARAKEWYVDVSYDPRSLEKVYLRDASLPQGFATLRFVHEHSERNGKSRFETEEIQDAQKRVQAAGENERQEKRILFDMQNEVIAKEAKKLTKEAVDPSASKAERTKNIRQNRADEKSLQRQNEHFSLRDGTNDFETTPPPLAGKPPASSQGSSGRLSLLKRHRAKRNG